VKAVKDYAELEPNIDALSTHIKAILSCRNFHHLNLNNVNEASQVVSELTKLDRLPHQTSLQGLLMLRGAWCEFDVAVSMSIKFKKLSKVLFALQLILGWLIVLTATLLGATQVLQYFVEAGPLDENFENLSHEMLFCLTSLVAVINGLEAYHDPQSRWRQLRSSACSLESSIWCYRARIGPYQPSVSNGTGPEMELCKTINAWRDELVSAADLQTTDLERLHPAHVYKHHQFQSDDGLVIDDDHHCPIKPDTYIDLRVDKMMRFYQDRLPIYTRLRRTLRLALLACTALSAFFAYYNLSYIVTCVTSLSGAVVSWSEYSEVVRKIERYTRAVRALKKMRCWWDVLTDVERSGTENITLLIESCENIIADERLAWQSTANRLAGNLKDDGKKSADEERTVKDAEV